MALLHRHPPSSLFALPLPSPRIPSAIPATQFSRPPLSGSLCTPLSSRGGRHEPVLRHVRGCATADSAIPQGAPPPSSRIFIKGLSCSTSEGFLVKAFSSFGEVRKVKIITSKTSKQSLGLAYIWFACEQDALMAVKETDGKFLDGRFVAVMIAEAESPSKQARARPYRF